MKPAALAAIRAATRELPAEFYAGQMRSYRGQFCYWGWIYKQLLSQHSELCFNKDDDHSTEYTMLDNLVGAENWHRAVTKADHLIQQNYSPRQVSDLMLTFLENL